jgi:hypothetical protein
MQTVLSPAKKKVVAITNDIIAPIGCTLQPPFRPLPPGGGGGVGLARPAAAAAPGDGGPGGAGAPPRLVWEGREAQKDDTQGEGNADDSSAENPMSQC